MGVIPIRVEAGVDFAVDETRVLLEKVHARDGLYHTSIHELFKVLGKELYKGVKGLEVCWNWQLAFS